MSTLRQAIDAAIAATKANHEEEGGVIIHHPESGEFEFIHLTNANSGTAIAPSLFTAVPTEYFEKVVKKFKDGWRQYASFHTHPAFTPYASGIDRANLFLGFSDNFIYAPRFDSIFHYPVNKEFVIGAPTYMVREGEGFVNKTAQDFDDTHLAKYKFNNRAKA